VPEKTLEQVRKDMKAVKKGLREAGIHQKLIAAIETRALRTGRRTTGEFPSNRHTRWTRKLADPQHGTELDCRIIFLKLWGMMLCFTNAPKLGAETNARLEEYLGASIRSGTYHDPLTLEHLDYAAVAAELETPKPGRSAFHLGHQDPTAIPRHIPGNIAWRSERSNLIQGDLTLPQARTRIVEIIARYFELGEVTITPAKQ
jgi:hypothetical protein